MNGLVPLWKCSGDMSGWLCGSWDPDLSVIGFVKWAYESITFIILSTCSEPLERNMPFCSEACKIALLPQWWQSLWKGLKCEGLRGSQGHTVATKAALCEGLARGQWLVQQFGMLSCVRPWYGSPFERYKRAGILIDNLGRQKRICDLVWRTWPYMTKLIE